MHVRGFIDGGTTTTPFGMVVHNELNPFHLAVEVIERVPGLSAAAAHVKQQFRGRLIERKRNRREHGEDMPGVRDWSSPLGRRQRQGIEGKSSVVDVFLRQCI